MPNTKSKKTPKIVILSGGTGRTVDSLLRAALEQFPDSPVEVVIHAGVRKVDKAMGVIRDADRSEAVVCHSLVEPEIRKAVEKEARRLSVPCIDVLGPAMSLLADHLGASPRGRAGLLYQVHHEEIDRMDAMDFTLAHDDGQNPSDLKKADVVLVGASRTSKSVTCCYLAFRGIRAANVPLIPNLPPPPQLLKLDPRRVVGLTMSASRLEAVRLTRMERMSHRSVPKYASLRDIQGELRQIRELIQGNGWECIDVSYKATEEVADLVAELLPRRRPRKK
ncbi:pyruvate, phosphate dikinase/phosphoenolpyruvate synthase regulator [Novipirellula artificiosorum]|uniref:Putative pyruvate, phosphate dikinase regulatory protein n=1 Tax=Novipirellula artificiosorum TaxID=2528016 RepID=A0A5C6E4H6_9BACT|nr:pyruvate, phosphate dikinase/phosphoenolpyruvate synthase regulator [Novipirellula artificiosorum]TWU42491.1 putative pyruvate, phosphate dikinase regulatory protein [Novipirellula artificiosorum]